MQKQRHSSRFVPLVCFVVALASLATESFAHRPLNTTIEGALTLTETELRYQTSAAHFLLPPAQGLATQPDQVDSNALVSAISEYIATHHPVTIDGIRVPPSIQDLALKAVTDAPYLGSRANYTRVTFTAVYAVNMRPKQISFVWQLYPPEPPEGWKDLVDDDQDPCQIIQTFDVRGTGHFVYFHPDEPEFMWHDLRATRATAPPLTPTVATTLRVPVLSVLLCIAAAITLVVMVKKRRPLWLLVIVTAGLLELAYLMGSIIALDVPHPFRRLSMPSDSEAIAIFETLHANVYRAFDYAREDEIYDVLAQSVDGTLLDELYSQIYRSLILRFTGGAVCNVAKVEILEATLVNKAEGKKEEENTLMVNCRWRVHGIVEHWEHLHRRVNEYQAKFVVSPRGGKWRICDVDITRQERVSAEDMMRKE